MATASSAQREPSMEEILASIRRIIEDSDSGRRLTDGTDEPPHADPAPVVTPAPEVEAFRAELRAGAEVRKPFTLAEVQAQLDTSQPERTEASPRLEAASPRTPLTLAEVGAQLAAEPPAAAEALGGIRSGGTTDAIMAEWRRDIAVAADPAKNPSGRAEVPAEQPEMRAAPEPDRPMPDLEVEIFEDELTEEPAATADSSAPGVSRPSAGEPFRPAIVSEHTGRQVAAAFGELSEAFASRGRKSFDEMAEDMLRPMLQDWLDNNLPLLVERLVREEIERVARGA
jgi:cell pole-organizing protein PopZ